MSVIEATNLRFSYDGERSILSGVSLSVEAGEALVLAGRSGCGKSTLCRCLTGVIPASVQGDFSGSVSVGGAEISSLPLGEAARHVALVFQDPDDQLICSTVEDELAFGLENLCVEPEEIRRRVDGAMERFGISDLALRDPAELSGGQKKLVTIAATLLMGASAVVFDEPMTGLDAESRELVLAAIEALKRGGYAVVAVEHDLSLAPYASRILYLRDGKLHDHP